MKPSSTDKAMVIRTAILAAIAGSAFLVATLIGTDGSEFVDVLRVVGACAFLALGYIWYRRSK